MKPRAGSARKLFLFTLAFSLFFCASWTFALDFDRPGYDLKRDTTPQILKKPGPVEIQVPAGAVKVFKKKPIEFVPFTLKEIRQATGRRNLTLDTYVDIPPEYANNRTGVRMKIRDILPRINRIEKRNAALGYSLRDRIEEVEIQRTVVRPSLVKENLDRSQKAIIPFNPSTMVRDWGPRPTQNINQMLNRVLPKRLPAIREGIKLQIGSGSPGTTGQISPQLMYRNLAMTDPLKRPRKLSITAVHDPLQWGDPKAISTEVKGQWAALGDAKRIEVINTSRVTAYFLGKSVPLLYARAYAIASPGFGLAETYPNQGEFGLYIAGTNVMPFDDVRLGDRLKHEDSKSFRQSYGMVCRFTIGPVPVSVEFGWEGELGATISLVADSSYVSATVTPFIETKAYADFAVDIILVKGGVGGKLDLIRLDATNGGELFVDADNENRLFYNYRLYKKTTISTLNGELYLFVKVWYLFGSKKYDWAFAKWDGFGIDGYSINDSGREPVFTEYSAGISEDTMRVERLERGSVRSMQEALREAAEDFVVTPKKEEPVKDPVQTQREMAEKGFEQPPVKVESAKSFKDQTLEKAYKKSEGATKVVTSKVVAPAAAVSQPMLRYVKDFSTPFTDAVGWNDGHRFLVMDLDGDRKDELLCRYGSGRIAVWKSDGYVLRHVANFTTHYDDANGWNEGNRFLVMDLNGDGKDELLARWASGGMAVWTPDGNILRYVKDFPTPYSDASGWNEGHRFLVMDINGDGKDEMLCRSADGGLGVWTSDGYSLRGGPWFKTPYNDPGGWMLGNRFLVMDLNGDGKDELLARWASGGFGVWKAP